MLRNFFITSLRILWRNKVVSAINILSLSIGITAFILILLYVHHETSYDKFNENYDRIYRLESTDYGRLPPIIGEHVLNEVPEVEKVTRIMQDNNRHIGTFSTEDSENFKEVQAFSVYADSTVFDVFTLAFVKGNPRYALSKPQTVVLTQSTARKLFGDRDPIGETIWHGPLKRSLPFTVTGIIQDVKNAHFKLDALMSHTSIEKMYPGRNLNQGSTHLWNVTYLLMAKSSDPEEVQQKINNVLSELNNGDLISIVFKGFQLRPMKDLYFNGASTYLQFGELGNKKLVLVFLTSAIFILMLAVINYINLTTARASLRVKEMGIKKVLGTSRTLLRLQFILDSVLIAAIAFLLAATCVQGLMPQFNQLAMINIDLAKFNRPIIWLLIIVAVFLLGTISGLYPALFLSSMKSISLVKGYQLKRSGKATYRGFLLTFQFSISILLIIGIITNLRQLKYIKAADLGFEKDQVINVRIPSHIPDEHRLRELFKETILQYPGIQRVASTTRGIGSEPLGTASWEIDGIKRTFGYKSVDPNFFDLMDINMVEGRNFSWDNADRYSNGIRRAIINETAAKEYWPEESPVNNLYPGRANGQLEVIGIVEDFHFYSLHRKIEPMIFIWTNRPGLMNIKISSTDIPVTIELLEKEWRNVYGSTPFRYSFLDENIEKQYKNDEQTAKIIGYFTVLAISIACMGLFALSSFMAVRRTKEIGIRKSMGASSKTIFVMLSREYIKWILLSALIASPIAWYTMNKWLESFAYRIELGPGVFILAAVIALAIGLITVGWQALKSAVANPVEALRYE